MHNLRVNEVKNLTPQHIASNWKPREYILCHDDNNNWVNEVNRVNLKSAAKYVHQSLTQTSLRHWQNPPRAYIWWVIHGFYHIIHTLSRHVNFLLLASVHTVISQGLSSAGLSTTTWRRELLLLCKWVRTYCMVVWWVVSEPVFVLDWWLNLLSPYPQLSIQCLFIVCYHNNKRKPGPKRN